MPILRASAAAERRMEMSEARHCQRLCWCTCEYTCTISQDTDHVWYARCTGGPCWFAAAGNEAERLRLVAAAGWEVSI
jgi:hypothetical protein